MTIKKINLVQHVARDQPTAGQQPQGGENDQGLGPVRSFHRIHLQLRHPFPTEGNVPVFNGIDGLLPGCLPLKGVLASNSLAWSPFQPGRSRHTEVRHDQEQTKQDRHRA